MLPWKTRQLERNVSCLETKVMTKEDHPSVALDRSSYVPYYRQISDQIQGLIRSKELKAGEPFWSEGELAQTLGVSKMTVRQAFLFLRREGLLIVEKGKRPTIGPGRVEKNFQELRGFSGEMARRGMKASSKVLEAEYVEPSPDIAKALSLESNEKVYRIRRLRFADNNLVGLEVAHLPAGLFPGLERTNLEEQSLYSVMETDYAVKLDWSEEELEAVPARKQEAKLLQVPTGTPLFSTRRTVYTKEGVAIEYCTSLFRGDRYSATVVSHRKA